MTITEMHQSFRFGMDKLDNLNYPNFLPEEIDLLLNQAQDRFVKQRYGITNTKRTSFEETQKRTDDLRELVRAVDITGDPKVAENINNNARFFALPRDYWFIIQERIEQHCDKCNDHYIEYTDPDTGDSYRQYPVKYAEVRPISHVEFDKVSLDAFKQPDYYKVLRLMYEDKSEIICSPLCNVTTYKLRYIKNPEQMSLSTPTNCELAEHTHQEIVDEAIKIALEGIEAKRNTTFTPIIDNQKE